MDSVSFSRDSHGDNDFLVRPTGGESLLYRDQPDGISLTAGGPVQGHPMGQLEPVHVYSQMVNDDSETGLVKRTQTTGRVFCIVVITLPRTGQPTPLLQKRISLRVNARAVLWIGSECSFC